MALEANLSTRLDAGDLASALLVELGGAGTDLERVEVPERGGDIARASELAASVDLTSLAAGAASVGADLAAALVALPVAGDALEPLAASLRVLERIRDADLETRLRQITEALERELGGAPEGGFTRVLLRLATVLRDQPDLRVLQELAVELARLAGVEIRPEQLRLPNLAQSVAFAAEGLGALMALAGALDEAEHRSAIIASRLDAAEVARATSELVACLVAEGGLESTLRTLDVDSATAVEAVEHACRLCADRRRVLVDLITTGMAFGEATLVHLDADTLRDEVERAASRIRTIDFAAIESGAAGIAEKFAKLFDIDLSTAPSFDLATLLAGLEERIGGFVAQIEGFDTAALAATIERTIGNVTELPAAVTGVVERVVLEVRRALEQIRDAVTRLPLDTFATSIRRALEPVAAALEFAGGLVGGIQGAVETASGTLRTALERVETAVDSFRDAASALFEDARRFVDGLDLDGLLGKVAGNVRGFADRIAQADMSPHFATAVDAIDTTTDVVEKVPFSMLPDSMEQDLVDAIRPIKTADAAALQARIEGLLQIEADGTFALRPRLEAALAGIQRKYDALVATVRGLDPRARLATVDEELGQLASRIASLSPQVELAGLDAAITGIRARVGGFDVDALLAPLREGFDAVLAAVDEFSPAALVAPLEERVDQVRQSLVATIRLRDWVAHLDRIETFLLEQVDRLDPARLEPRLEAFRDQVLAQTDRFARSEIAFAIGNLLEAMTSGSGLRAPAGSFGVVLEWLFGGSGTEFLTASVRRSAAYLAAARAAVESVELGRVALEVGSATRAVERALAALPAGAVRDRLAACVERFDVAAELGRAGPNRTRYLDRLTSATETVGRLGLAGLSEVDVTVARLRTTLTPFRPAADFVRRLLERVGLEGIENGIAGVVRHLFDVASPARLAAILEPVFSALRNRFRVILDAAFGPLREGARRLEALVDAIDLTPLRAGLDEVHGALRAEIQAFHPDALLAGAVSALHDAQARVAAFDPLRPLRELLSALRDTSVRVVGKLRLEELLRTPLAIWESVLVDLEALDLRGLLGPLLDQLDAIALGVAGGLDATVAAFERLQDALPDRVGSTSLSGSASVSAGTA